MNRTRRKRRACYGRRSEREEMKSLIVILCLIIFGIISCSKKSDQNDKMLDASPSLRISVLTSGKILVGGKETTLPELDKMLIELKKVNGTVWYYREAGQEEPPPQAMEVIKLVADKSLPVTLSSKPDFSDYVGEDGQSHLRKK